MKDIILKWIYRRFAAKFNEFLVDDFVQNIPAEVVEESFSMISSNKKKMKRLVKYLAYNLHKKMANDPTNSARYQGMFIQLKVMDSMIIGRPDIVEPKGDSLKTEEPSKFADALKGATDFAEELIKKRKG